MLVVRATDFPCPHNTQKPTTFLGVFYPCKKRVRILLFLPTPALKTMLKTSEHMQNTSEHMQNQAEEICARAIQLNSIALWFVCVHVCCMFVFCVASFRMVFVCR